jgi:hypothetical protein
MQNKKYLNTTTAYNYEIGLITQVYDLISKGEVI